MATASPFAIDYDPSAFDPSKTYSIDDLPTMAEYQAQQQADINKREHEKIKRLQQVGKDMLGRAPGQPFYDYFGEQYDTLISEGMSPDDAVGVITTSVSGTSESLAFKEDERVAAQYEGAPDWFVRTPGGGSLPGHNTKGEWIGGHEGDFQASLDPSFLTGFSSALNDQFGYFQGNTVGTGGLEWFGEQYQDHVTHLVENEGYSFADADAEASKTIGQNIQEGGLHSVYAMTGNIGPVGQKLYIDDGSGGQNPVYLENTSKTLGFNPADPNQPFYDPDVAALGGYQPYFWDVTKNPDAPTGIQTTALNEAAKHHEDTFLIQTEQGIYNPFKKPIDDALAGLDVPTINAADDLAAGPETVGLFIDQKKNEEYKEELETGNFTNPQGLTGTFVQNPDGSTHIAPNNQIASIYDKDGNLIGNDLKIYNQNPGSTLQITSTASNDKDDYLTNPLIQDPFNTLDTGLYDEKGFTTSKQFQTKVNEFEDRQGGNYVYGGGGGGTTIINQTPQKNKTAEMQQIKQDVRGTGSGRQRKYHKFRSPKPASIPGATGGLNIPTG